MLEKCYSFLPAQPFHFLMAILYGLQAESVSAFREDVCIILLNFTEVPHTQTLS